MSDTAKGAFIVAGFLLAIAGFLVVCAYFESKTYNRLTGAHTTTWDALWVDLRVMDTPKK